MRGTRRARGLGWWGFVGWGFLLVAVGLGGCSGGGDSRMAEGHPARLIIVSGDQQVGVPGEELPEPLVVRLEDQFGNPAAGEPVTGAVVQGEGVLLPSMPAGALASQPQQDGTSSLVTVTTDSQGHAAFRLQVGTDGEAIMVEVTAPQLPQVGSVEFLTVVGLVVGLIDPVAIAIGANGRLVVVDRALNAVVRVHPVTGSAIMVSSDAIGGGPPFFAPFGIAVEANGRLVVIDDVLNAVVRVDPVNGNRIIVSGCVAFDLPTFTCTGGIVGSGPQLSFPRGIAVEATGQLVVVDEALDAAVRVDPVSGNRTIVSAATTGRSPPFLDPRGVAVEATGQLVVVNGFPAAVVRLDPMSGSLTTVSGCAEGDNAGNCVGNIVGGGPLSLTQSYRAITVEATGQLVVAASNTVVRVDPVSGDRTIVSGCVDPTLFPCGTTRGLGPPFLEAEAIAVGGDGQLVIVDRALQAVVRVDPISGNRTIVVQGASGRGRGRSIDFPNGIAVEADGQLVVAEPFLEAVVGVDPVTGDRTIVSGCTEGDFDCTGEIIGGGPPFVEPMAIAVGTMGQLMVTDRQWVVQVNPASGDRSILSGCVDPQFFPCPMNIGGGPPLINPRGLAVEAIGSLAVMDFLAVVRVDPRTGDRTIVSGCTTPGFRFPGHCLESGDIVGGGPTFINPRGLAVEAVGSLVVVDSGLQAVMRVDPVSGDRLIISDATTGIGPTFVAPEAIAVEADSQLMVVDSSSRAMVRVDPVSGSRAIVSDATIGRGQSFSFPASIAVESTGQLVVGDTALQAVVRVDPISGDRTLVSR